MYKNTIKPVLKKIFTSRKALAVIAGAIVWALAQAGVTSSPDKVIPLLVLIGTYVLGQSIADFGQGKVVAEKEAIEALGTSLGKPQPPSLPDSTELDNLTSAKEF